MIEVHLYGRLRTYGPTCDVRIPCVVLLQPHGEGNTVGDITRLLGISREEVGDVFCDGMWDGAGLKGKVDDIARVGLFPPEMAFGSGPRAAT